MLFNSGSFAVFLPILFILYWLLKPNLKLQNFLLLGASYFFYACWDYRFLTLLIFSTVLDYFTGLKIGQNENKKYRKMWLWTSIIINLGFLGVFKYYDFFASYFSEALYTLGVKVNFPLIHVILPVGISFYTFHGLSYVIDIYNNKIQPEKNFIDYAVFVSFFPLLVAGPIERATHLLPQIKQPRSFNYAQAVDGLRQILWGLFKKMVIADNCATLVNTIFDGSADYSGSTHIVGAVLFAFEIYCDFSGYSDIALGTARLFGIELLRNFAFPYFSRDIAEFWRRWHISLSSWFRDYVYIPLGGSAGGRWMKVRNTFVIFLLSGFWHGANWTFIAWGFINAIYFLPLLIADRNRINLEIVAQNRLLPSVSDAFNMGLTFGLTVFAWIFFRAESMNHAFGYVAKIFSPSVLTWPELLPLKVLSFVATFLVIEWLGRENRYALEKLGWITSRPLRWSFYYALIVATIFLSGSPQQFIYFQF